MKAKRRLICIITVLTIALCSVRAAASTRLDLSELGGNLFSCADLSGGLYFGAEKGDLLELRYVQGGSVKSFSFERFGLKTEAVGGCNGIIAAVLSGTRVTVNGVLQSQLQILTYNFSTERSDVNTVSSAILNKNGFALGGDRYFILQRDHKTVKVFSLDARPLYTLYCDYYIYQIEFDSTANRFYAISDGGILLLNGRQFSYLGELSTPVSISGSDVVFANDGKAYRIRQNGLDYLCSVPTGTNAAAVGEVIYYCKGATLYGIDFSGSQVSSLNIGYSGGAVYPCGSLIGVIGAGQEMITVSPNEMKRTPTEPPPSSQGGKLQNTTSVNSGSHSGSQSGSAGGSTSSSYGKISSSVYKIDRASKMIFGIKPQTTIAHFKANINYAGSSVFFRNSNGSSKSSGYVGTGFSAYFSGADNSTYTLIVSGDLTGEGNINSLDVKKYMKFLCGEISLGAPSLSASDLNGDGVCDTLDLVAAARY